MAQVNRLPDYTDLDYIEAFAVKFGLHPDEVYTSTDFDTWMTFLVKWKLQGEFQKRFDNMVKLLTPKQ